MIMDSNMDSKKIAPDPTEWLKEYLNRLRGNDLENAWEAVWWFCFELDSDYFFNQEGNGKTGIDIILSFIKKLYDNQK